MKIDEKNDVKIGLAMLLIACLFIGGLTLKHFLSSTAHQESAQSYQHRTAQHQAFFETIVEEGDYPALLKYRPSPGSPGTCFLRDYKIGLLLVPCPPES